MTGDRSFVVADVPGLIEGAHEGHGLGDRFLKHLDRTKLLVHLVDVSGETGRDPIEDFETIRRELSLFSAELGHKPQLVAATKMDAAADLGEVDRLERHVKGLGLPFLRISAVAGTGLPELQESMWKYLSDVPPACPEPEVEFSQREVVARRGSARRES